MKLLKKDEIEELKILSRNPLLFDCKRKLAIENFIKAQPQKYRQKLLEIQNRIDTKNSSYIEDLPIDPEGFELKRRELIDNFFDEIESSDILIKLTSLQFSLDVELGKALVNLDKLEELAKKNPDDFEKQRKVIILRQVLTAHKKDRHKLKQLQWKIDAIRSTAKNPLDACVKLNEMLTDHVYGENGFVDKMSYFSQNLINFKEKIKSCQKRKTSNQPFLRLVK